MDGPRTEFRRQVAEQIGGVGSEQDLERLLGDILARVEQDTEAEVGQLTPDEAFTVLGAAEAWLSLSSYALNSFYSPESRRKDLAGWSNGAAEKLRKIADALRRPLNAVARALGSVVFSVGVAFPFGASISISWTP